MTCAASTISRWPIRKRASCRWRRNRLTQTLTVPEPVETISNGMPCLLGQGVRWSMVEPRPDQPRQGGLSRRLAEDRFRKSIPAHVVIAQVVIAYVVMRRRNVRPDRHEPFPAVEDWHALFIEARGNAHRLTSEGHEAAHSRSCSR